MRNAELDEAQAGIKTARRNINHFRYADDTTLMTESKEELKSLLMKMKEENEKAGLKLNTQKTKIMAFGPITPWKIDGENMEIMTIFIFLDSKITVDGEYNLDSILKSRDITLPTMVCLVKAMVFLVVMYGWRVGP